ncbi:MAG: hypothetical protein ACR2N6_02070 [Miltoncostaeaceae bacterium]
MNAIEHRDALADRGVVGHLSEGGWGLYHRESCSDAPRRGQKGIRDTISAPWGYLSLHWEPCPRCRPPGADISRAA